MWGSEFSISRTLVSTLHSCSFALYWFFYHAALAARIFLSPLEWAAIQKMDRLGSASLDPLKFAGGAAKYLHGPNGQTSFAAIESFLVG
jgi:hypothetical protein